MGKRKMLLQRWEGMLSYLDPGDGLDPSDRDALHRALAASQEDVRAGRLIDAEEILRELRRL